MTDFKWTPLRDIPTYTKKLGKTVLPAGVEITGFLYSSTERQDKFFCENISFETFLSAIPNPYSRLYEAGRGQHGSASYGVVCNGFVRYALGIPFRVNTKKWFTLPYMRLIANHDEYFERFKVFSLCRYDKLDEVPLLDEEQNNILWSGIEKISPKLSINAGNKANYLVGEEVVFAVNTDEPDTLELFCNGSLVNSILVDKLARFLLWLERGYYEARLKKVGESVEFCMNEASVSHSVEDGIITVSADPCDADSKLVYADFRLSGKGLAGLVGYTDLTEEEKAAHRFSRKLPDKAENFKVYYKNKYGVWTHPMKKI